MSDGTPKRRRPFHCCLFHLPPQRPAAASSVARWLLGRRQGRCCRSGWRSRSSPPIRSRRWPTRPRRRWLCLSVSRSWPSGRSSRFGSCIAARDAELRQQRRRVRCRAAPTVSLRPFGILPALVAGASRPSLFSVASGVSRSHSLASAPVRGRDLRGLRRRGHARDLRGVRELGSGFALTYAFILVTGGPSDWRGQAGAAGMPHAVAPNPLPAGTGALALLKVSPRVL